MSLLGFRAAVGVAAAIEAGRGSDGGSSSSSSSSSSNSPLQVRQESFRQSGQHVVVPAKRRKVSWAPATRVHYVARHPTATAVAPNFTAASTASSTTGTTSTSTSAAEEVDSLGVAVEAGQHQWRHACGGVVLSRCFSRGGIVAAVVVVATTTTTTTISTTTATTTATTTDG